MKSLYYWTCGNQEYFPEVYMGNPGLTCIVVNFISSV